MIMSDSNNIAELSDENGEVVAHYEYSSFGSRAKDNVRKIAHILIWVHGIRKEALYGF